MNTGSLHINYKSLEIIVQHCLADHKNTRGINCYICRCMKSLYRIWHKQPSKLAHTTFSKTIWAFRTVFLLKSPNILSKKLSYSQHSGWCCWAFLESGLVDTISSHSCHPAAHSAIYLYLNHTWDTFISPLTNHTVKWNWKIKAVASVWTEPEREEWKSINCYEQVQ